MTFLQALLIAALQGATELFPVSSLGHAVLLPALMHWQLDERGEMFLPFLVMLHAGTALALLIYFRKDWLALASGLVERRNPHVAAQARRVAMLLVVATIPAVLIGFVLEKKLQILFGKPLIAALFLAVNGVMLLASERLRGAVRPGEAGSGDAGHSISSLSMKDAFVIGCWQCLALIPGVSRSGSTIVGALLRGIDHARAAHFSFLIALPIIVGATALETRHLFHQSLPPGTVSLSLFAAAIAGIVAYVSTSFLMRWFRNHDNWALDPFGWYCIVVGLGGGAALLWL